jgi:hypothetical protein
MQRARRLSAALATASQDEKTPAGSLLRGLLQHIATHRSFHMFCTNFMSEYCAIA